LKLLLIFGSDAAKVQEDMKRIQNRAEELQKRVQVLRETMKMHQAVGKDINAVERELQEVTEELVELDQKARQAQTALRGMANSSRDIRDNLFNLRDIGEKLERVGSALERAGRAILSPITGGIQTYLQAASPFDTVAQEWRQAQQDIQNSFVRIGAVATQELLPAIRAVADLVEKIAAVVERNPELVKAAMLLGGGLLTVGGLAQFAGQVLMLIGVLKGLDLGRLLGSAGTLGKGILLNPYVGVTAAIGTGAYVGYNALAQTQFGQERNLANAPGQLATIAAYYAGKLFGEDQARRWALSIGELTGAIERNAQVVEQTTMVYEKQLDAYQAYRQAQNQRIEYEQRAQVERNQILLEFAAQRAQIERNYESSRNSLIAQYAEQRLALARNFARVERQAEQDYYQNRLKLSQSYQIDVQRAEEDHQRRMRRLRIDHEERLQELIENRDALGIIREQRAYERQRQEEEEAYRIQAARRSEDFARQIQELDEQFAIQRQRRLEEFRAQMAELARQHQQRMLQLRAQYIEELRQLNEQQRKRLEQFDKQYKNELQQLYNAEQNRLNILRALALNDQAILQRAGMELTASYRAWLEQQVKGFSATTSTYKPRGRASGGYVFPKQAYLVGEQGPELFVPSVSGTIVPNSLTQSLLRDTQYAGGKVIQMQIETSSLTLNQVMREVERLLARRDLKSATALGG